MSNIELDEKSAKHMAQLITDIAAERERQGLSQSRLSELAGIKQSALSRMESLKAFPQLDTLYKILQPLNLKLVIKSTIQKEDTNMKITNTNIQKLIIDTKWCNLNLTRSNDNDFHMVTANEDDFTFEKTDDTITIKQKKRKGLKWLFSWIPLDIKITVPDGFCGLADLSNSSGKTRVYSISLNDLSLKNNNGSIVCEDVKAGKVWAHSGNGRIKMLGTTFECLDCTASNGSVKLGDVDSKDFIKAKTSNGSVVLKNCNGADYVLGSSNGSVVAEGSLCKSLTATTSNGSVSVSLPLNESEYCIDFSTSNGSIRVGNHKTSGRYSVKNDGIKLEAQTANGGINFRFADTIDAADDDIFSESITVEVCEDEVDVIPNNSDDTIL